MLAQTHLSQNPTARLRNSGGAGVTDHRDKPTIFSNKKNKDFPNITAPSSNPTNSNPTALAKVNCSYVVKDGWQRDPLIPSPASNP